MTAAPPKAPAYAWGERKALVLAFVRDFYVAHGYPPTVRDVQRGVHLASSSTAHYHLLTLVSQGKLAMIERQKYCGFLPADWRQLGHTF